MITLEISVNEIRLMEIEEAKVIKWASRSLEPGIFEEGVIIDPQAWSDALRQLMRSSGIQGGKITASVSGLYSLSRIILVATPPGETVTLQAVMEVAVDIMPLREDELYISWHTIAITEGGDQVLVIAVPRDIIDSEVQALRMAGVNPRILDLKAMALARVVNREQAIILNIGSNSYDVVMVVNGVTEIMRTTAWQADDLVIEDKADALAVALELTVGFYNSHHPGFPISLVTPLFVTGQMSGDLALMEKLKTRIEYPIEPLAPPLDYPEHLPVSQYAVNIGLALKGAASPKSLGQSDYLLPDVNLLPQVYEPWKPSARQIYFTIAIVVAIALIFPLYQVATDAMAKTTVLETKYNAVNREMERRKALIKSREPLQAAIGQYNTIISMGGSFIEDLQVITNLAEELNIKLGSIDHNGNKITFHGQADSYTNFRKYKVALEESGRFFTPITPPEGYPYVKAGSIELETKPSN